MKAVSRVAVIAVRRLKRDSIILLRIGQGAFDLKSTSNQPDSDQLTNEWDVFPHIIETIGEEVV